MRVVWMDFVLGSSLRLWPLPGFLSVKSIGPCRHPSLPHSPPPVSTFPKSWRFSSPSSNILDDSWPSEILLHLLRLILWSYSRHWPTVNTLTAKCLDILLIHVINHKTKKEFIPFKQNRLHFLQIYIMPWDFHLFSQFPWCRQQWYCIYSLMLAGFIFIYTCDFELEFPCSLVHSAHTQKKNAFRVDMPRILTCLNSPQRKTQSMGQGHVHVSCLNVSWCVHFSQVV